MGLIKLDCLAVIRARCGQALAMVVRPHLLRQGEKKWGEGGRGGGGTAGWPLTQRREPRAKADSCHGRGRRPAIISFPHMVYDSAQKFRMSLRSARPPSNFGKPFKYWRYLSLFWDSAHNSVHQAEMKYSASITAGLALCAQMSWLAVLWYDT